MDNYERLVAYTLSCTLVLGRVTTSGLLLICPSPASRNDISGIITGRGEAEFGGEWLLVELELANGLA